MKARINTFINNILYTPKPLPPGVEQAIIQNEDGSSYRLHLRIEPDGRGILILNAATILHLNNTGAEMAHHLVNQTPVEKVVAETMKRYQVSRDVAQQDFEDFKVRLNTLVSTPDLDPETFLDMEQVMRHTEKSSAPLRLDCALTYQLSDGSTDIHAPVDRVKRMLDASEWKTILDKSWEAGIPHVVFTGGEPTLRPDLFELVSHAESLGQVTGLITDGLRLTKKDYLHELLITGLDHLMIILQPNDNHSWEAVRDAISEDVFVTVHITVDGKNTKKQIDVLEKLQKLGVKSVSISSDSRDSISAMKSIRQKAAELSFSLVYDLPVPYSTLNPVTLEMEELEATREGAGISWLYVEPDGDVLPGQGNSQILGNLLSDPWASIWVK